MIFFAGSGTDPEGIHGSPLIILDEIRGVERRYCKQIHETKKTVYCTFNELVKKKNEELKLKVDAFFNNCIQECDLDICAYRDFCNTPKMRFEEIVKKENLRKVLSNKDYAKFIILDQYGFKQVNEDVFSLLVNSPKTDFIFFIASSFISRFRDLPAVTAYFDRKKINFNESKPKECHKVIADYFRSLIPIEKEYYLHHFTIKKGRNYYGLIFGSNHTLGMEKFLSVCWKEDPLAGESNCNTKNDFTEDSLFYNSEEPNKIQETKKELRALILENKIDTNIDGLKFVMKRGCLPKIFVEEVDFLKTQGLITIEGSFNKRAQNIHSISKKETYKIRKNEDYKNRMD